jgi:hypothetical protein
MKDTKINRAVIKVTYPLSLLFIICLSSFIPSVDNLPPSEASVYWQQWRIVVLASIIPMVLYFAVLSISDSWEAKVNYFILNTFVLFFPVIVLFLWFSIKSFVLFKWQIPTYYDVVYYLIVGGCFSFFTIFISIYLIEDM